jgi:hypothetical protein
VVGEWPAYLGNLPRPVMIKSILSQLHSVKVPSYVFPKIEDGSAKVYLSRLVGTELVENIQERVTISNGDLITIVVGGSSRKKRLLLL